MNKTSSRLWHITLALALALGLAVMLTSGAILGGDGITYIEDFDTAANWDNPDGLTGYGIKTYTDTARPGIVSYYAEDTLRETAADQDGFNRVRSGVGYAWRLRNQDNPFWRATITEGGVGEFSVWVRRWNDSPDPNYIVEYSLDNGTTWTELLTINNAWLDDSSDWKTRIFRLVLIIIIRYFTSYFSIKIQTTEI